MGNRTFRNAWREERDRILQVYEARPAEGTPIVDVAHFWMCQTRERVLARLLRSLQVDGLGQLKVLEIGCGDARWLRLLNYWGVPAGNLYGCDINPDRLRVAVKLNPSIRVVKCDSEKLPYGDQMFGLVLQSTVFSSILDSRQREVLAREMARVTGLGGAMMWYDLRFSNPWNANVRGISKREVRALFPGRRVVLRSCCLLPPLVRFLSPISSKLCSVLDCFPFLRYAYLGVIQ